jgi:predicted MPP superfamily phosphohydrolase
MQTAVLHLSDIHFKSDKDVILKRMDPLIASIRPYLTHASVIVIAITGDIAQSGDLSEYKHGNKFLSDLKARLKKERDLPIHFVISPGNHDCDFRGDQSARQLVVGDILKTTGDIPESYLKIATKVQSNYFAFRAKHESKALVVHDDPLWTTYCLKVDGMSIALDALNASWISTKHEQQGGLLFPFETYQQKQQKDYDLRICLMHHPFNWYSQVNYRAFREFLHRQSDIILAGHEHVGAAREIEDAGNGHCIYIDGEALQTGNAAQSGFNVLLIDNNSRLYKYETLRFRSGRYEPQSVTEWERFRPLGPKKTSKIQFSDSFKCELRDPGATLKHFSGRELTLDDIFVFPDVDDRSDDSTSAKKARAPRLNTATLVNPEKIDKDVLLQGDDEAGKTRLLFKLAMEYQARGYYPILLRCDRLKSANSETLRTEIGSVVAQQYGEKNRLEYLQAPFTEKIALLDDFDRSTLNADRRAALISELRRHFHRLIITVGENFEVKEIFGGDDLISLADMRSLKILPFGHARRLELIRKWNRIGFNESTSENQFLSACDEAEKLIESTKLRYVATTNPIFVLSLLQATSSGVSSEMHNSSFAHYYYFLIVGALEKAKTSKQDLNVVLSACTHLSWYIRKNGHEQRISQEQYKAFVAEYSNDWTFTDPEKLLNTLTASRLLENDGEGIGFTYPYSYYYFLGKYTSISQETREVKEYIDFCLKHLYARECANTLLFLAHHSGTSSVLNSVKAAIDAKFANFAPATLDKDDVQVIAGLLANAPEIRYQSVKPSEYRQQQADADDRMPEAGDGLHDAPVDSGQNTIHDIVSLFKAIEIAGTLLTHQFSNYDRATKNAAIASIFNGTMRAVKLFHGYFKNTDDVLKSLSSKLRTRFDEKTSEELELSIRNGIAYLIKMVTASLVMKAAANLRTKELDDNIVGVVEEHKTLANRLIKLSQELQRPNRLPRLEVDRLKREQESNPAVMSVLQLLILQRLYMYETDHDDKHWAMSLFELGGNRTSLEITQMKPPKRLQ